MSAKKLCVCQTPGAEWSGSPNYKGDAGNEWVCDDCNRVIEAPEATPTPNTVYRFISDPGHGWLEVPMAEVRSLGILPSPYSYVSPDGQLAYLEEDCDAALFIKAKWGRDYMAGRDWSEVYFNHDAPCRSYRRFPQ